MKKAIFFCKRTLLIKFLVKALEAVDVGENRFLLLLQYVSINLFVGWQNIICLKDSCTKTLYLLDSNGFDLHMGQKAQDGYYAE